MKKNITVLLIDMNDFFIDTTEKEALVPNQIAVLTKCSKKNLPVIVVDYPEYGFTTAPLQKALRSFSRKDIHSIEKFANDAFHYGLRDVADALDTQLFLIMGINAGYCVGATAKTAKKHGFEIATSKDLIAGYEGVYAPCCKESWYEKNGIYTETYKDLLKELSLA